MKIKKIQNQVLTVNGPLGGGRPRSGRCRIAAVAAAVLTARRTGAGSGL